MTAASLSIAHRANNSAAGSCSTNCKKLRSVSLTSEIIRICQTLIKGDGSLRKRIADRAACSLRTVDYWISGDSAVSMENFFHLLDSQEGVEYLRAFWDQVPDRVRDRFFEEETLRRSIAERRRLREIEDREAEARIRQLKMNLTTSN